MRTTIRVLSDKNLFGIKELLKAHNYEVDWFTGEFGLESTGGHTAQALVIRTVTKINASTLTNIPNVEAIVSASAGVDHVDLEYLKQKTIYFSSAAGSNARAVAEYVLTAITKILAHSDYAVSNLCVGVVGVGAVGTEVNNLLLDAGVKTILYDPPRQQRDRNFQSASLDDLKKADILTFHTPLINDGIYKTHYLFDDTSFWKDEELSFLAIINASRGGVLNEQNLLSLKNKGLISYLISDVWENEPYYHEAFRKACLLATPHIAGYSLQAKLRASWQSIVALNNYFGKQTVGDFSYWSKLLLSNQRKSFSINHAQLGTMSTVYELLKKVNPLEIYHQKLAELDNLDHKSKALQFKALRTQTSLRNEYPFIAFSDSILEKYPLVRMLQTT